jgi:hypothetical protein
MWARLRQAALALLLLAAGPGAPVADDARATEGCWSGWGYRVEPESLAFRSERLLLATDGPVAWVPGREIALYRLDPRTGQRLRDAAPIRVRPQRPSFGHARGNRTMDDIAEVVGDELDLMLGMTRIGPASVPDDPRQRELMAWACGRAG